MLIGPFEGLLLNKHWIDSNYIKKTANALHVFLSIITERGWEKKSYEAWF